jgi:uncharacterized protein (DUF362 family)
MNIVVFRSDTTRYPEEPPFHPPAQYPEIAQKGIDEMVRHNSVYSAVRKTLAMLGLDAPHFGTPHWNPLGKYVHQGGKVVIKPNFVLHEFGALKGKNCLTTHGSILRAIIDYTYLASGPEGSITIADAPIQGADFELLLSRTGVAEIQEFYSYRLGYEIKVLDLRQIRAVIDEDSSFIKEVHELNGDSLGYRGIDMGPDSRLSELDTSAVQYAVGDYDTTVTNLRHNNNHHQYVVSNTILEADTIISVPKLKTHSKVGLTVCLKNFIGIIGSKDCLPHHRLGKITHGGDEFPADYPTMLYLSQKVYTQMQGRIPLRFWKLLRSCASYLFGAGTSIDAKAQRKTRAFFPSGGWHGNDTIWRTVDDLNRIVFYYDKKKNHFVRERQRRFFAIVDGIIAMESNGPLRGTPRPCGVLLAGEDPLAVDVVAATLMGFDWQKIRMLNEITYHPYFPRYSNFAGEESQMNILSNEENWRSFEKLKNAHFSFHPPTGWQQYVEV